MLNRLATRLRYLTAIAYTAAAAAASAYAAVELYKIAPSQSDLINTLLASLAGGLLFTALFYPLILNLKKILRSLHEFALQGKDFNISINFPRELWQINEANKSICQRSRQSNQELKRQDVTRRELLANAAHDIKGPLSSIIGYLDDCQARLDKGDMQQARDSLAICTKNTKFLEKIVLEIFEAAKFDNLEGNLALEVASIDELLSDIVQKYQRRAQLESKILSFRPEAKKVLVQVDLGLMERAISNIIDNALKYTPVKGNIAVGTKLQPDGILIYISDSGRGIPEKDLPYIFDRLYRVERDRSKESKGSGFGLSITKKVIEAHYGKIFCSSNLGQGTVFQILLPVLRKEQISSAMAELISKKNTV